MPGVCCQALTRSATNEYSLCSVVLGLCRKSLCLKSLRFRYWLNVQSNKPYRSSNCIFIPKGSLCNGGVSGRELQNWGLLDLPSKRAVAVIAVGESFELGSCQCGEARQFSRKLGNPQVFVSLQEELGQLSYSCLHLLEPALTAYLACVALIRATPIAAKPGENEGRRIWESFASCCQGDSF